MPRGPATRRAGNERAARHLQIVVGGLLGLALAQLPSACDGPQEPQAPGGGSEITLDYETFLTDIEPILQQRGCSNSACHGGQGSGELLLSGGASPEADFLAVRGHVTPWDPAASPLLRKPLAEAAGGTVHGGGAIFPNTEDPDYTLLFHWVTPESTP